MSQTPEDPATLVALTPDLPIEPPLAPIDVALGTAGGDAELFSAVGFKLAGTLFLHHVCLGAWFVTLGTYVSAHSGTASGGMFAAGFIGVAYGAGPLGAMVSPFLTGWLADRHFAAERIMAVLQLCCAAALCGAIAAPTQGAFYIAVFAYFLFFHPSASLASSMALHHLRHPAKDFPVVRAGGTAGWIAAGVLIGWVWPAVTGDMIERSAVPMQIGVAASLATAAFSLFFAQHAAHERGPRRAPPAAGRSDCNCGKLVRDGRFMALMILAVAAHIPSQFYYAYSNGFFHWAEMESVAAKMTLGQVVEMGMMLLLPFLLARLRVKTAIAVGLSVWCLRYLMLAASASDGAASMALMYAAIMLHGLAFTLVSISLQLDVDRWAGRHRRSTAQGLFFGGGAGLWLFCRSAIGGRRGRPLVAG